MIPHAPRFPGLLLAAALAALAVPLAARDAARLELRPQRLVLDSFDWAPVEVLVYVDEEILPSLPEDIGARVVGGSAQIQPRWSYQAETNSWSYRFEIQPGKIGLHEIEFYHRELDSVGATSRLSVQVIPGEHVAAPRLYRAIGEVEVQRIDPTIPITLLPLERLRILIAVDEGDVDRLSYEHVGTSDLTVETLGVGDLEIRATGSPEFPGLRHELVVRDTSRNRPTIRLPLLVVDPCVVCGGAHHEDTHRTAAELEDEVGGIETSLLDPSLLATADAVLFQSLNLIEPAPTYLETTERVLIIHGRARERLSRLSAVLEYPDGKQRQFPGLEVGRNEAFPFRHSFRLHTGTNRLYYLITASDGSERKVQFNVFRTER